MNIIVNSIIKLIENELLNSTPDIEAFIYSQIQNILAELTQHIENKLSSSGSNQNG